MPRPGAAPFKKLPMLEARREALEKCVFCPKLCRSACPVSNAEPRETLIPWGKMSSAYFVATGSAPAEASFAAPAWACTGCFACRDACDHRNDVAGTLLVARAGLVREGIAPAAATATVAGHDARARAHAERVRARFAPARARTALLVGCGYVEHAPEVATDAVGAARALVGADVDVLDGCCGLPLLLAGDGPAFTRTAEAMARAISDKDAVLVADAGCALALRVRYAEAGVDVRATIELVAERAAREVGALRSVGDGGEPLRWHDPCALGRGLGVYDAPRAVLTRLLGRPPDEMDRRRERAACSGAGGLVPVTMPETSRAIARDRVEEHARAGGGRLVTACASSLRAFRAELGPRACDLVSLVAKGIAGA